MMSWETGHPQRERLLIDVGWPHPGSQYSSEERHFGPHHPRDSSGKHLPRQRKTLP